MIGEEPADFGDASLSLLPHLPGGGTDPVGFVCFHWLEDHSARGGCDHDGTAQSAAGPCPADGNGELQYVLSASDLPGAQRLAGSQADVLVVQHQRECVAGNPRIYGQLVNILHKYSKFATVAEKTQLRDTTEQLVDPSTTPGAGVPREAGGDEEA